MKTSETIAEIASALGAAQGVMAGAVKTSENPYFKSNYSDLSTVIQALSKPFHDNNLSFTQGVGYKNGMVSVTTRLMHKSGEWFESTLLLPTAKTDKAPDSTPQAFGSCITYGRRYGLQSLAGLPSIDDDANFASAVDQTKQDKVAELALQTNEKLINGAADIEQLVKVWSLIPPQHQLQLKEVKNAKKQELTTTTN